MPDNGDSPAILLPYQKRWIADKSQLKIGTKSRQIGFTWGTALESVLTASAAKSAGGMNVWYMTNKLTDGKLFIKDVSMWSRALNLISTEIERPIIDEGDDWNCVFETKFNSGYSVTALSSNPDGLRGKGGLVILDEAAYVADLGRFLTAARAFTIWGGRIILISTQGGVETGFNALLESIRAGKNKGSIHQVTFDDAIEEGFYKRICHVRGIEWTQDGQDKWRQEQIDEYGDMAGQELFCIPSGSGGRYLSRKVMEQCTCDAPVLRLKLDDDFALLPEETRRLQVQRWIESNVDHVLDEIPEWQRLYFGEDFGRKSDLSVLCPMVIDQDMTRRIPFLVEMRNVTIDQQRQVIFHVMDRFHSRQKLVGGLFDAGGNGAALAEDAAMRYGGATIRQTHLRGGAPREERDRTTSTGEAKPSLRYSEAMPPLKARFEDRGILIPKDRDVIQDLEMFERVDGLPMLPSSRIKGRDNEYRHGDAGVAIMLAHYATLEMASVPLSVSVPKRNRKVRL